MSPIEFATELMARGMKAEDALAMARMFEESVAEAVASALAPKPRTANAERQARFRERRRLGREGSDVTGDVTRNVTGDVTRGTTGDVTPAVTPSPPPSSPPGPPSPPTPTPASVTTRVSGADALADAKGFAAFWQAYPNKVGKGDAVKAYAKAVRRIAQADPEANPNAVILSGVERAQTCRKWREGYIPNPSTWLNQDRWTDEHPTDPRPPGGGARAAASHERLFAVDEAMGAALVAAPGRN